MTASGFLKPQNRDLLHVRDDPEAALARAAETHIAIVANFTEAAPPRSGLAWFTITGSMP